MQSVNQLLDQKGHEIYAVKPTDVVFDAIEMMATEQVGALMVMDGEALRGVVSERDYARKVILKGRSSKSTTVAEIMSTDVITVTAAQTVDECLKIMTGYKIRHLPVMKDAQVVGVLSIGDLVKSKLEDQQRQIESLEQYIAG